MADMQSLGDILKAGSIKSENTGATETLKSTLKRPGDTNGEKYNCERCRDRHYVKRGQESAIVLPCPYCLPTSKFSFDSFKTVEGTQVALNAAMEWAAGDSLHWLTLIGRYGCGKTHLARAAHRALMERMIEVQYIYAVEMFDSLRNALKYTGEEVNVVGMVERRYMTPEVLIIDDLGAEKETDWVRERFERIMNYRYENELRTMITSNLKLEEWPPAVASRVGDRVKGRVVYMTSADYRRRGGA